MTSHPHTSRTIIRWIDLGREPNGLAALACLALIFIASSVVRIVISDMVPAPYIFDDELIHIRLARSIWEGHGTKLGPTLMNFPCWLYPMALAPWVGLLSMEEALEGIRGMNAALASMTIFFSYGLAREVASHRRSLAAAFLTALLPGLGYSPTVMSESMFLPVFTLALWLGFRAIAFPTWSRRLAAGLIMGLAFHIKPQGLYLPILFATTVITFEIACLLWGRQGARPVDTFARILSHWLTALGWLLMLTPRLAAMKWIDGIHGPLHLRTFLGSYYGIGAGQFAEGGMHGFLIAFVYAFSVMVTGVAFLPLLTVAPALLDRDLARTNQRRFLIALLAMVSALGMVALTTYLIRSIRIHERYFMVAYPSVIAAFCALTPRTHTGSRICLPFLIWGVSELLFFRFVQTPSILNEWYVGTDSPTFSGLRILTHPANIGNVRLVAILSATALALVLALSSGRLAVLRAAAIASIFFTYNLAWYVQHDRVTRHDLRPQEKIATAIIEQIPHGHRLIVLLDGLHPEIAKRALFFTASDAVFIDDLNSSWFAFKLIPDSTGAIILPPADSRTWLLVSSRFDLKVVPARESLECKLYRFESDNEPLQLVTNPRTEEANSAHPD